MYTIASILIWLFIWILAGKKVDNELFLPTPPKVYNTLKDIMLSDNFKDIILFSAKNITKGFFLSLITGIILACISSIHVFFSSVIDLPIKIIKAVPVASFTILALLWINSENLSVLVSFLMGLPIIYTNVYKGINETDQNLINMAKVFHIPYIRRIRYIYLPYVIPYFMSAISITAGMCWKSGIAAEVIGITKNSIGNELYQSKLYLETPEIFAYTFIIIILSIIFEKIALFIFKVITYALSHTRLNSKAPEKITFTETRKKE